VSLSSIRQRSEGWYSLRRGCAIAEAVLIQTHILSFICCDKFGQGLINDGLSCDWKIPVPWVRQKSESPARCPE